jgi:two-component system NarL family sensor kinase
MDETAQLRARNRELSILNTIAEALNHQVDLSQALNTALTHIVDLFNLQTGWVWLLHEAGGEPYLAAAHNLPEGLTADPRRMEGTRYCYCLDHYRHGNMEEAANISIVTCTRLKDLVSGSEGLRNHASVPLRAYGNQLGLLNVVGTDWRELHPDELRLLHTVGDMLSSAVARARLFERSAQLGIMEERSRLAREIHDTLAQALTAISLRLETADALLDTGHPDQAHDLVMQALQLTRASLEDARRSVLDLRAAPLEGRSLAEALAALCTMYTSTEHSEPDTVSRPQVTLKLGEARPLAPRLEMGIYRIVQEALNNIARHAQAQRVWIDIHSTPQQVEVVIEDDGIGFDMDRLHHAGRFGLIGLNERARLLGGELDIRSAPGAGATLRVRIPIEQTSLGQSRAARTPAEQAP